MAPGIGGQPRRGDFLCLILSPVCALDYQSSSSLTAIFSVNGSLEELGPRKRALQFKDGTNVLGRLNHSITLTNRCLL